jgi:hypothetical protein
MGGMGWVAVPVGMGWVEATHGRRDAGVEYGRQTNSPATAWVRFQSSRGGEVAPAMAGPGRGPTGLERMGRRDGKDVLLGTAMGGGSWVAMRDSTRW